MPLRIGILKPPSKYGFAYSFLYLLAGTSMTVSASFSSSYKPSIEARNTTYFGEIDITNFPSCAVANCITSDQLAPSRLGCVEPELTTGCLCQEAPTPLACSPEGPSDQDNCWYDLEDWFAGVCSNKVAAINVSTVPECMQDCVKNYLLDQGCHTETRNCFCILPRNAIIQAAASCYSSNCLKQMKYSFSPTVWHDNICNLGEADVYDQEQYEKYKIKVRKIRISLSFLAALIFLFLLGVGMSAFMDNDDGAGTLYIIIGCAVLLVTIVPIYTVL